MAWKKYELKVIENTESGTDTLVVTETLEDGCKLVHITKKPHEPVIIEVDYENE